MKKKMKAITVGVIVIISIAASISYFIFFNLPEYPLESHKLVRTWFASIQDLGVKLNVTFYFYSNGSGKNVEYYGPETTNDTFL